MRYFIGNYEVKNLCSWHGIKYGKQKMPNTKHAQTGICDVCEATRKEKNAPQSVLPVADYQGILMTDAKDVITVRK